MRHPNPKLVIAIVAGVLALGFLFLIVGTPQLQAIDFDALAREHGTQATSLLQATGFPHATTNTREVYQFVNVGPDGTIVTYAVDWATENVTLTNRSLGNADAVIELPPGLFDVIVNRYVLMTQGQFVEQQDHVGLYWNVVWHTHVTLPNNDGFLGWRGTHYKWALASWAAEFVAHSGGT